MLILSPYFGPYSPYEQYLSVNKKNSKEFGILASKSRKIRHKNQKHTQKNRKKWAEKHRFEKYHYVKFTLADGKEAYFNIVQHKDGKYYLYTINKHITSYE